MPIVPLGLGGLSSVERAPSLILARKSFSLNSLRNEIYYHLRVFRRERVVAHAFLDDDRDLAAEFLFW